MDQFGPPTGRTEPLQPSAQFVPPMSAPEFVEPVPARSRSRVGTGIAIAAVAIGALGLGGVAYAATTSGSSPTPSAKPSYGAAQPGNGNGFAPRQGGGMTGGPAGGTMGRGGPGMGGLGMGGLGMGLGGAIHGTAVTPKQGGGYQTVDGQRGAVTDVSSTSITVKSEDGFTKTYVVTADTLVNAKRDGIASVKKGDTVSVIAVEAAGAANAVQIVDQTQIKDGWQKWMPGHDKNGQTPGGGSSAAPSSSSTGTA
jgi:hypothetical protein